MQQNGAARGFDVKGFRINKNGFRNNDKVGPALDLTEEQMKGMFMRYDSNGDGRLDKKELENAFNALGSRLPGFRAALALNYADANGDGVIEHKEFDTLVKYAVNRGYKASRN